jgi:hypothetical protein
MESAEVVKYFDTEIVQEHTTEKVVKGYRVKVEYDTSNPADLMKKQGTIVKTVVNSLKRKKDT